MYMREHTIMENNDDYVLVLSYDAYAQLRIANGYKNDSEVAKLSGVTTSTISGWKMGTRKPSTENLRKLAAFFGVPMDAFYEKKPQTGDSAETAPAAETAPDQHAAGVATPTSGIVEDATDSKTVISLEELSDRARLIAAAYDQSDWVTRALIDRVIDTRPA